jgi:hypothetical protein
MFPVEFHVHHHFPGFDLAAVLSKLDQILAQGASLMADLAALQAEVTKVVGVEQSAITLIQGLSAQLKAALASADPAALQAVIDQLDAKTTELAAAVAAPPA